MDGLEYDLWRGGLAEDVALWLYLRGALFLSAGLVTC